MARAHDPEGTRRKLLDEGVATFLLKGFHGTGIKEVLDRVRVPKGSFYNYFASKEEFGAAAIRHYSACLGAELRAALDEAADPLSGLRLFFERQMEGFKAANFTGGCLVANLGGELEGNDVCRQALLEAFEAWRSGLGSTLADAQAGGLIRTDLPSAELGDMLVDAWEGAVIRMKIQRSLDPLRDCLRRHLDGYFQIQG